MDIKLNKIKVPVEKVWWDFQHTDEGHDWLFDTHLFVYFLTNYNTKNRFNTVIERRRKAKNQTLRARW